MRQQDIMQKHNANKLLVAETCADVLKLRVLACTRPQISGLVKWIPLRVAKASEATFRHSPDLYDLY